MSSGSPATCFRGGTPRPFSSHREGWARCIARRTPRSSGPSPSSCSPIAIAGDDDARARFRREALAAARLSTTPNVVTVFDVAEHDGRPAHRHGVLRGRLGLRAAAARGASRGRSARHGSGNPRPRLDQAHANGIVHRDVKPANLFLDAEGNVHVTDFGIASASGSDTLTSPGMVLGTAGYLAPEQARGEPATAASDRYALGVVAFELLTGRRPYEGDTPTTEAFAHLHAEVPSATELDPSLPARVDDVFSHRAREGARGAPCECARPRLHAARGAGGGGARAYPDARLRVRAGPCPCGHAFATPRVSLEAAALPTARGCRGGCADPRLLAERSRLLRSGDDGPSTTARGATRPATTASGSSTSRQVRPARRKRPRLPRRQRVTAPTTTRPPTGSSAASLNASGYARMQAGDYAGAVPLLRQAVLASSASGTLTEAYSSYNLAYSRFALGRCDGVTALLDRSEQVQGRARRSMRSGSGGRTAAPAGATRATRASRSTLAARPRATATSSSGAQELGRRRPTISPSSGKRPTACFENSRSPSTRTSNCERRPGVVVASTPTASTSSAARLAARWSYPLQVGQ